MGVVFLSLGCDYPYSYGDFNDFCDGTITGALGPTASSPNEPFGI
jgi:hypothetical protein